MHPPRADQRVHCDRQALAAPEPGEAGEAAGVVEMPVAEHDRFDVGRRRAGAAPGCRPGRWVTRPCRTAPVWERSPRRKRSRAPRTRARPPDRPSSRPARTAGEGTRGARLSGRPAHPSRRSWEQPVVGVVDERGDGHLVDQHQEPDGIDGLPLNCPRHRGAHLMPMAPTCVVITRFAHRHIVAP